MNFKIKKLRNNAVIPTRGTTGAAGFDLYANNECKILPQTNSLVPTGISVEIPDGFCGLIFARSGLAHKRGLRPSNAVGLIDSDYRGEIFVSLYNDSNKIQEIMLGDRIAQIVFTPVFNGDISVVDELSDTERATGGFGSTGE